MSKYMFVFRGGDMVEGEPSPDDLQAHMQKWMAWMGGLSEQGILHGGEPLNKEGTVVAGRGGSIVTDGPFAEGKELVGGYLMVEADSLASASEIAKGCPILEVEGTVEVREIQHIEMQ